MAIFTFNNIKISAIAGAVPKNIQRVEDYKEIFGEEEVNKFIKSTGIVQSRRTNKHQTCSDLGYTAAAEIIRRKNLDPAEIGCVIFASHSPDYRRPATAFVLHKRLGLKDHAIAYDISLGCSSLIYGVQTIAAMMNSSDIKKAILVVGDTAGKSVHPEDRSSVMLFGEAGAAILLEKTEEESNIQALLRSDGSGYRYMIVPGGGYRNLNPPDDVFECKDGNPRTLYNSFIQGTAVFTFTIFDVPKVIKDFFAATGTTADNYDSFAFHQANLFILKQIAKKTKIPMDKMPISLDKYGNTSGASPLISLIDAYGDDNSGQKLNTLFCGFGIGVSWGIFSAEISTNDIYPILEDDSVFEEGVIHSPNELYAGLKK
ncbi:MAG: 3-oxoacyl-ACP synthase III family protein [Lewinella sp.]|uniref:3-oxoacyl-ACP synthase III family protein n=1 Tax=Lewinella sp. TaxID=2004506 RepID=UPI003D6AE388